MYTVKQFRENSHLYVLKAEDTVHWVANLPNTKINSVSFEEDTMFTDSEEFLTINVQFEDPTSIIPVKEASVAMVGRDYWGVGVIVETTKGVVLTDVMKSKDGRNIFEELIDGQRVLISLKDSNGIEFAKRINEGSSLEEQYKKLGTEITNSYIQNNSR